MWITRGYGEGTSFGYSNWTYTDISMDMQDMFGYLFGYPNRYLIRINSPKGPKDIQNIHRYPNISADIQGIQTYP